LAPSRPDAPLGIYIHIPFCAHICPYCDFNTYAGQNERIPTYVEAVVADLGVEAERFGRLPVASIFFGGGTPSLLTVDQIALLMLAVQSGFGVAPDAEVTLEANPNGLSEEWLCGIRAAGVNRISIGLQTTDRRGLRTLGRMHEATDAESAVTMAVAAGFERISLDLIFGWPGQTLASWQNDLQTVLSWSDGAVRHLSLYSLIVEPGTPMADAVTRGIVTIPDDDATADLYEVAIAHMRAAGWQHYEIANFAATTEDQSVHNRIYWRNGSYLGVGAGAYGRTGAVRTMRHLLPATYTTEIGAGRSATSNAETIDPVTSAGETIMLGFRLLDEGIERAAFLQRYGVSLDELYGPTLSEHIRLGLVDDLGDRIRLTSRGMMVANDVCAAYLP